MKNFKEVVKSVYRALKVLSSNKNTSLTMQFVDNIKENVDIAIQIASAALAEIGIDAGVKTRGVQNALSKEIIQELEIEEMNDK